MQLTSGLILFGSPPSMFMASRIHARSTTAGTPVKSCESNNAISIIQPSPKIENGQVVAEEF